MASGGVSRSGRVRKKSAKLMEMEDWDALDLNDGLTKAKKKSKMDDIDYEAERKVAPIKIPKAATVATKSMPNPVKRRGMDDMIHLKNLQNIQESGYLNVPTAPKTTVQATQHPQAMYTASAVDDDSSSSSSESSETSSEEDSDSDDSVPYARPIQRVPVQQKAAAVKKAPYHHMVPQPKAAAIEYDTDHRMKHMAVAGRRQPHPTSPLQHHIPHSMDGGSDMINVEESDEDDDDEDEDDDDEDEDDDDDTRDSHLVIAEEQPTKPKPGKRGPPARGGKVRARKANDDPEYEEPGRKSFKKSAPSKTAKKPAKEKAKGRPMTAYMLWCQERRKTLVAENPGMDFATISKKLGEAWQMLPDKEKIAWKRKAKVPTSKGSTLISTGRPGAAAPGGPRGIPKAVAAPVPQEDTRAPAGALDGPKSLGTGPIDVAAHLKLLGESLSTIGRRLTEHEGQIAVSGSLSVLLDSTLCALGPLLCLTSVSREMDGCSKETLTKILNNVAYVMPGL